MLMQSLLCGGEGVHLVVVQEYNAAMKKLIAEHEARKQRGGGGTGWSTTDIQQKMHTLRVLSSAAKVDPACELAEEALEQVWWGRAGLGPQGGEEASQGGGGSGWGPWP